MHSLISHPRSTLFGEWEFSGAGIRECQSRPLFGYYSGVEMAQSHILAVPGTIHEDMRRLNPHPHERHPQLQGIGSSLGRHGTGTSFRIISCEL